MLEMQILHENGILGILGLCVMHFKRKHVKKFKLKILQIFSKVSRKELIAYHNNSELIV